MEIFQRVFNGLDTFGAMEGEGEGGVLRYYICVFCVHLFLL